MFMVHLLEYIFCNFSYASWVEPSWDVWYNCTNFQRLPVAESKCGYKNLFLYIMLLLFVDNVFCSYNGILKCRQNSPGDLLHLLIPTNIEKEGRGPISLNRFEFKLDRNLMALKKLPLSSSNPRHDIGYHQIMVNTVTDPPSKRNVKILKTVSYGVNNRANSILVQSWELHLA